MTARPILMSQAMVRALLAGSKTQTRRLFKDKVSLDTVAIARRGELYGEDCRDPHEFHQRFCDIAGDNEDPIGEKAWTHKCPYGQPGDFLWVKEKFSWAVVDSKGGRINGSSPLYSADSPGWDQVKWKPSIHMPKAISRLTLELTEVRVERLQDISEADAIAEGLACITKDSGQTLKFGIPNSDGLPGNDDFGWPWTDWHTDPRQAYQRLWESINGPGSWQVNPFVWCLSFRAHQQNVDALLKERVA